jgi:hypothetical protein
VRAPRFLHIGLSYQLPPTLEMSAALDATISSEAFDWMRYSFFCYLVWSSSDAETICRKILRVPGMQGCSMFVSGIDTDDGFGYLPPWAWEWIKRDRGGPPVITWHPVEPPGLPTAFPTLTPLLPSK